MSRRRWLLLGSLALILVLGAVVWVYLTRDRGTIRYENLDKIKVGMTMAEVEKQLGCSPGNHASGPMQWKFVAADGASLYMDMPFISSESAAMRGGKIFTWHGDRGYISVEFDEENKVIEKKHLKGRRVPASWWLYLKKKPGLGLIRLPARTPLDAVPPEKLGCPKLFPR